MTNIAEYFNRVIDSENHSMDARLPYQMGLGDMINHCRDVFPFPDQRIDERESLLTFPF